jgi:hypothetical protein
MESNGRACGGRVAPRVADGGIHWLTISAPVRSLTATIHGSCALLVHGNTACWHGAGPDTVVRNDVAHPSFVDSQIFVGRTATGQLWKGVFGRETGRVYEFDDRSWVQIPSDSAIVRRLSDKNGLLVCGLTAWAARGMAQCPGRWAARTRASWYLRDGLPRDVRRARCHRVPTLHRGRRSVGAGGHCRDTVVVRP